MDGRAAIAPAAMGIPMNAEPSHGVLDPETSRPAAGESSTLCGLADSQDYSAGMSEMLTSDYIATPGSLGRKGVNRMRTYEHSGLY